MINFSPVNNKIGFAANVRELSSGIDILKNNLKRKDYRTYLNEIKKEAKGVGLKNDDINITKLGNNVVAEMGTFTPGLGMKARISGSSPLPDSVNGNFLTQKDMPVYKDTIINAIKNINK